MKPQREHRTGLVYGFAAYGMWGLLPLYWPLMQPAGALEILAQRMVWSLVTIVVILAVMRHWAWIPPLLREPRRLAMITVAATVISLNWGIYIWGVNTGHVVEVALGYFINPLISIAFGVLVLRERLRPAQWAAVGIGVLAVVVLSVAYGRVPWVALVVAFSFGVYALVKKQVGLSGLESLAAESAVQFLPALVFLGYLAARGQSTFGTAGVGHTLLLVSCGTATALPLLAFGSAAVRLPLSTIGMLQYIAPTFQFVIGLAVFHEEMPPERWAGFVLVWLALSVLTWDAFRTARNARTAVRRAAAAAKASVTAEAEAVAAEGVTAEAVTVERGDGAERTAGS
ncbi:EamA family transporter RarD [Streptomyces sp. TP-A0874]|uniref:EamA family transporter RarD n=1 Tax=Streptomyces sp. TP-A0874 TaxID=549819 RepID=UPI000853E89C|nr:EamA family transporter RarD [Streptomyces sp. TP-A0874]